MNLSFKRLSLTILIALIATSALAPSLAKADYTTTVTPTTTFGTWDGWGCSLCWWANQFGERDDLADIAFSKKLVDWQGTPIPGLGFNIARYNVGGCGVGMTTTAALPAFKKIQGFWLNWNSAVPTSASFDWTLDAKQRLMLAKAKARGVDQFEMFSDSPMWWMLNNRNPAGGDSGGDNLQNGNYQRHARYLAIVAKFARDRWGVNFNYVEPFNEPRAWWWKSNGGQEGCHFDTATQKAVISYLRQELDSRGLQATGITASDENSVDDAISTWSGFDGATQNLVSKVNTHGYSGQAAYRGPNRGVLRAKVGTKKLWQSEYGESDKSGMTMADSIIRDINEMHASAWVYWQPFDSGGWGLIQSNPGDNWIGPANPKYFVMAQFSRHLKKGMTLLNSGDKNTVAAYDSVSKKLILISVNYNNAGQWISYDLSRFKSVVGGVLRWMTNTGIGEKYVSHNDTNLTGKKFSSWFPANTVQTFEVSNVTL